MASAGHCRPFSWRQRPLRWCWLLADDPNAKTKQGKSEANFYTAELALQRRAKDAAMLLLWC